MTFRPLALAAAAALLALAACWRDEPSVAERFNEISGMVENKGRAYEAIAENQVTEEERQRDAEADALLRQRENAMAGEAANAAAASEGNAQ